MKIEFLSNGSDDCPLIRIYGDNPRVCMELKYAFEQLATEVTQEISLSVLSGVESVQDCRLIASGSETRRQAQPDLQRLTWFVSDLVAELVAPVGTMLI